VIVSSPAVAAVVIMIVVSAIVVAVLAAAETTLILLKVHGGQRHPRCDGLMGSGEDGDRPRAGEVAPRGERARPASRSGDHLLVGRGRPDAVIPRVGERSGAAVVVGARGPSVGDRGRCRGGGGQGDARAPVPGVVGGPGCGAGRVQGRPHEFTRALTVRCKKFGGKRTVAVRHRHNP